MTTTFIQDYTWRAPCLEDMPALYNMLDAVDRTEQRGANWTLADLKTQFEDPWCPPETDFRLAFTPAGQVAAMARVFSNPDSVAPEYRAFLWSEIHPQHQAALQRVTFDWMQARGQERLQAKTDRPRLLRTSVIDTDLSRIALCEQYGFAPIRCFYRMRRDLAQPVPAVELPAALTLRPYSRDVDYAMWETFVAAFQDHWGFEVETYEDWQMFFTGSANFRPDLSFVVMAGDQLVGFSYNTVCTEANARQGLQEGWIGDLGVRRAWRRRGIATALLCASMQAFCAAGLAYATLGVDTENLTGALRLYERLGFVADRRSIAFEKKF